MPLNPLEARYSNREHAFWRVEFRRSLLLTHRATSSNSPDWLKKEAEFEQWLREALDGLMDLSHDDLSLARQIADAANA